MEFDYVIVGAGSAGCVLAHRLSADSSVTVALLEAGPGDAHPYVHMPRSVSKLVRQPARMWYYRTQPEPGTGMKPEVWLRGKVLGGSSSVNGMVYVRGQPDDFDWLAAQSSDDWSWRHIGRAYAELEDHELGPAPTRGGSGPLKVSLPTYRTPLTEAVLAAGAAMGWPVKQDLNAPDGGEGIGYLPRTIHRGRRQSAAIAFLAPIAGRPNLTILINSLVDRVIFGERKATGVELLGGKVVGARREVILSAGALATPGILERSGVGDPKRLAELGIPLVHANPEVGENLIDHRILRMQWRLRQPLSQNRDYRGWRLIRAVLQYYLTRTGPMSHAAADLRAEFRTRADLGRPDAQALFSAYSWDLAAAGGVLEKLPGMYGIVHPLRPTSRGRIHISSRDPNAPPVIEPNYRSTDEDQACMIAGVRTLRRFAEQAALRPFILAETAPGRAVKSDEAILAAFDRDGMSPFHAVGSCRMGNDDASVVDPQLRVRELANLRIMDTSVMPAIPSGNTNAPTMAMAWRAAEIIAGNSDRRD